MTNKNITPNVFMLSGLGWWNVYFIIKIALYLKGSIDFHPVENFAFLALLLFPLASKRLAIARTLIAVPIGLWLMHFDSYLPPLNRLWSQMGQLMQFETSYLIELLGRFVSPSALLAIFTLCIGYFILSKYLRISVLVVGLLVYISLPEPATVIAPQPGAAVANTANVTSVSETVPKAREVTVINDDVLNNLKNDFFTNELKRSVSFNPTAKDDVPFDLLFLSICSVAWDDIEISGLSDHPIFKEFDIMFDRFNAATSYSGPALVRLLRANCGQETHGELFDAPASNKCYLFENLAKLGFKENLLMNHDGVFDNFLELLQQKGKLNAALMPLDGFKPYEKAFDGDDIYRDKDVLDHWWQQRIRNDNNQVVALYNTISLHDGNRVIGGESPTNLISYKRRLKNLLDDLYGFFQELKASKRNIVVMLVPEHGAGMRGDRMQIPGMREIPAASIVHTHVGLKVFGDNMKRVGDTVHITDPSSYLAVSQLVSNILDSNIYKTNTFDPKVLTTNLPKTKMVAQNSGTTVMEVKDKHYISLDGSTWSEYPTD
ncbi:cellulose biosynthesis protein BcsG [Shewanella violacea]|uniref:Cellulose biosynthesis protein BcsG n=1 Tax=Shewanella violacea (strain JCM 10179 / CIP 106290 / LMG 19151 / DSS12) TaxID=637905 RepID=D4ZDI3_SHEVD|nr:cellulose biosynthesis protein BcsG [Shewanella violacea]BAJ00105.1 conserved hypothetical protein [Shewanella violacea DSS12]